MSEYYCPNCPCPDCQLITRAEQLKQQRIDEIHAKARVREASDRERRQRSSDLFRRECAMVWLLVNTARNQTEANQIIQRLAEAMLLSPRQVDARRSEYARRLTARVHHFTGDSMHDRWAALPGTQGTELPDYCEKCGGMKTMGRKCKRCDYRRSRKR